MAQAAITPGSSSSARTGPWLSLLLGTALCISIALIAEAIGRAAPLVGAPIFAILIGVALSNLTGGARITAPLRIKEVSSYALRGGIVVLGFTLNLHDVVKTGVSSLSLLAVTMTTGLLIALLGGRWLGVDWRMRSLIGIGTTICGASAIAALAPVIRAKHEEIAYSISVIFLFNMLAVIVFPGFGHLMHLSDTGFGLWAGTAVNDTSAVVAAGFAFSQAAGTFATVVKLTRTTLIIPLTLAFGLLMPWLDPQHRAESGAGLGPRLRKAVPWFIGLFVLASLVNTAGLVGAGAPVAEAAAKFILVVALAAVGLQGHWRAFAGAGLKPLVLGLATWAGVSVASLGVQLWTSQL